MDAFDKLISDPTAAIRVAVIITPHAAQGLPKIYATDAPKLGSEPGDAFELAQGGPVQFGSILAGGYRLERRLTSKQGTDGNPLSAFAGRSKWTAGTLTLSSHARYGSTEDGPALSLIANDSQGWQVDIYAGGDYLPGTDRRPYPLSEYRQIGRALVRQARQTAPGVVQVELSGTRILGEQPASPERYRGFGTAARLASGESLSGPADAAFSLSSGTCEFVGVVRSLPASTGTIIRHDSGAYGIAIDSAGRLGIYHDAGAIEWTASPVVFVGQAFIASLSYGDSAGTLRAGRRAEFIADVASTSMTLPAALGSIEIGGGAGLAIDLWGARTWSTARTFAQVRAVADTPMLGASGDAEVIEQWKASEGSGDSVLGFKGVYDLAYSTTPLGWVASLEGEDEEVYGDSIAGQSKPRGFGAPYNAPVSLVSQQFSVYQADAGGLVDLRRLKDQGAPLAPVESITTAASGDLSFAQSPNRFILDPSAGLSFRRFVPGAVASGAIGQKITVENAGIYNGDYRVAVNGIDSNDLVLRVVDELGEALATPPAAGDLPSGAILRTSTDASQYSYSLAAGVFDLPQAPRGRLTVDAVFEGGEGLKASELIALLLGETPSGSFAVDPVVAGVLPTGAEATGAEATEADVYDAALTSALGWLAELRGGGYRIGTHGDPGTDPVAAVIGEDADVVFSGGEIARPPVVGKWADDPEVEAAVSSSWRVTVAHSRNWSPFEPGSTVEAVDPSERARLEKAWRYSWRDIGEVREAAPVGTPENALETWIRDRPDAERLLDEVAVGLLSAQPGYVSGSISGLGFLSIELGDVILVQHPDPGLGIRTPRRAVVSYIADETSSALIEVEAYLV